MSAVSRWIAERVPISGEQLRELTNEPVPHHLKRWWFCLGGTPAYLFVVQIVTGILLVGLLESGALDDEPNRPKVAVKLAVAIVLTGVAEATKRRDPLPTWAFHLVGGLALVNVLVAVLW